MKTLAKANIEVIENGDEVRINMTFNPPLEKGGKVVNSAQAVVATMVNLYTDSRKEQETKS